MYSSDLGCAECGGECGLGVTNLAYTFGTSAPLLRPTTGISLSTPGATQWGTVIRPPVVVAPRPVASIPVLTKPPVIAAPKPTVTPIPLKPSILVQGVYCPDGTYSASRTCPIHAVLPQSGQGGGGGPSSGGTVTLPNVNEGAPVFAQAGLSPVVLLAVAAAGIFLLASKKRR